MNPDEWAPLFELEPSGLLRRVYTEPSLFHTEPDWDPEPLIHRLKRSALNTTLTPSEVGKMAEKETRAAKGDKKESSKSKGTKASKKKEKKKKKKKKKEKEEVKELGLDLLVLVDYSVYAKFLASAGGEVYSARAAVHRYFATILAEVGRIYAGLKTPSFHFRLYPAGVVLARAPLASPWIPSVHLNASNLPDEPLDAYTALKSLKKWLRAERRKLPDYDHAIAFTRTDLHRFGDGLAQGIAFVKSICHRRNSASLAEDVGAGATVAVIAHELAHSLGAEHDGSGPAAECPVNLNYLMVPSVSSQPQTLHNTFRFSPCTIRQIEDYLQSHRRSTRCLRQSPRAGLRYQGLGRHGAMPPGQLFDAHAQCRQAFSPHHRFCQAQDYYLSQMCGRLWCRDRRESRFAPCRSKHYLPALAGTSCGHRMWCLNGACVEDEKAPPLRSACAFGDRDSSFCIRLVTAKPSACSSPVYQRFCCKTCKNLSVFGAASGLDGYRLRQRRLMSRFRFLN